MTTPDPAAIARGLSKARSNALCVMPRDWFAGPEMPKGIGNQRLEWLRANSLVEREFGDLGEVWSPVPGGLKVRLTACWWYRLTPLGLAVKAELERQSDGQG